MGDQIHLQCAADAAVLERDQTVVRRVHDSTFLDEVGIDVDFAYVIDYDRELDALLVGEYSVDQCSLAASEVSCQEQYRCFPVVHCYCHGCDIIVKCMQNYDFYFS